MDRAPRSDLNSLDRDALLALFIAQQEKLDWLIADRDAEFRRLEDELQSQRQTLSERADELRSRSERIEHLELMVEKLRHVIFGTRSGKIVIKLEQMELELEDDETTHAELEAAAERVSSTNEPKARPERRPLPEHLQREVITHAPSGACCADCGGERAAAMYSLIGSAKLNGLDPELYLRTVLAQIADYPLAASRTSCHGTWHPLQIHASQAA